MRPFRILFLACFLLTLGCATTTVTGPDAGPPGPPVPSETAKIVSGYVAAGLGVAELGLTFGVEYAADQGQDARCYWLLGLEAVCRVGGRYAGTIPASGRWLSKFDEIEVNVKRCNPLGTPPRVSPEVAATVEKLGKALTGPILAVTRGVLTMAGVPCGWVAWAEGIEAELLALPVAIVNALAGAPFILPEVVLRECPAAPEAAPLAAPVGT